MRALERAVFLGEGSELSRRDLRFEPAASTGAAPETELTSAEKKRGRIERMLSEENGRVEAAAAKLGIPRSTLYEKLRRFGLGVPRTWMARSLPAGSRGRTGS